MRTWALFTLLALAGLAVNVPAMASDAPPLLVVHFTTGPNWQPDLPPQQQTGFVEHSANLRRLRDAGRIHFGARYGKYGMIFLAADSVEAARAELDADPGVVAGIFTYEVAPMSVFYPWREEAPAGVTTLGPDER